MVPTGSWTMAARGFDAAVRPEDLEPGRSVRDREGVVRLDEGAVGVAKGGHERVLGRSAPRPLVGGERDDVGRQGTEQRVEDRGVVAGDVQRHAAACTAPETPALEPLRQHDRMEDADGEDAPDGAVGDQMPDRAVDPRAGQVVVGRQDDAGALAGVEHRPAVFDRQRERLLAQDVLAGRRGHLRVRPVEFVRAC